MHARKSVVARPWQPLMAAGFIVLENFLNSCCLHLVWPSFTPVPAPFHPSFIAVNANPPGGTSSNHPPIFRAALCLLVQIGRFPLV